MHNKDGLELSQFYNIHFIKITNSKLLNPFTIIYIYKQF